MRHAGYVFFLLFGCCHCIQYPLSYQYQYSGTVMTGLPDVGTQRAAASIRFTVIVDTVRSNEAIVRGACISNLPQFHNTRVGDHHGDTHCGQVTSGHKAPLKASIRELFHKPFLINFHYSRQAIIKVAAREPLWMTNVRKAVVGLLRVVPSTEHLLLRSPYDPLTNRLVSQDKITPLQSKTFSKKEDTMYGNCEVQYTLTPASPSARAQLPVLARDIQTQAGTTTTAGGWPKVSDHLYFLQRTIDFDVCTDQPVQVYSTNSEERGNKTSDQYEDFISQSSLGRFLIRGENHPKFGYNIRLERAQVESGIEVRPLGTRGALVMVVTNQTLQLESTSFNRRKPRVQRNYISVPTIKFEMTSPFAHSASHRPDWIRYEEKKDSLHPVFPEYYATGIFQNNSMTEKLQSKLLHECSEAARILETSMALHSSTSSKARRNVPSGATVASEVTEHLFSISSIVKALPKAAIEKTINEINKNDNLTRQILYEGLASSGSTAAIEVLLHAILSQKMSPVRSYATLSTIVNAAQSPAAVNQLFTFSKQLAERMKTQHKQSEMVNRIQRALLTVSILGTSSTLRRVCKASHHSYYGAEFDKSCNLQHDFLLFIQARIKGTKSTLDKATLLHALGSLDLEEAHNYVVQLATSTSTHMLLRTAAIYCLMPQRTPVQYRDKVLRSLQPVVESQVESPEIRQVAVMTVLAWRPGLSWWLSIARASWQEESKAVAEFVFTVTKAIAELTSESWHQQSDHARRALPLVRPVLTTSRQSFIKIIESFLPAPLMESETTLGWILNLKTMLPEELFLSLSSRMNGVRMPLVEVILQCVKFSMEKEAFLLGDDLLSFWQRLHLTGVPPEPNLRGNSSQAKLQREFYDVLRGLGAQMSPSAAAEGLLLLRVFSDLQHALPLHLSWLHQTLATAWHSGINEEMEVDFVKYIDPVRREVVLPSEIGLPIVTRIHSPALVYQKGKYKLTAANGHPPTKNKPNVKKANTDFNIDASYTGNTTLSILLESTTEVLVPWAELSLGAGLQLQAGLNVANTTLGIKSTRQNGFSDVQLHAFTGFNKKVPVGVISVVPFTVSRTLTPGADMPGSRMLHNLKEIHTPHTTTRKKSYKIPSTVTGIHGHVTYQEETERHHSLPYNPWAYFLAGSSPDLSPLRSEDTTLFLDSAGNATNSVAITFSYAPATEYNMGKKHRSNFVTVNLGSSREARLKKLHEFTGPGGWMASLEAEFAGGVGHVKRHFELMMLTSAAARTSTTHISQRHQLMLLRAGIPATAGSSAPLVLESMVRWPWLPPMDRLDQLLHTPLTAGATAELKQGTRDVANIKVDLSISHQEMQLLSRRLPLECNFDRVDPTTSLRRAAFYDDIHTELRWKQDMAGELFNSSYHAATVLRALVLPYTESNCVHVDTPERLIVFNITRSLDTKRATGWLRRPGCLEYIEDLPLPSLVDMILPLHGQSKLRTSINTEVDGLQSTSSGVVPPTDQCYVLPTRVVTFDGVSYDTDAPTCNRVVVKHVQGVASFMVLSKQLDNSENHEYRIVVPADDIDIIVTAPDVKVNGVIMIEAEKLISDSSKKLMAKVTKSKEMIDIDFPHTMRLLIKEGSKLMIHLSDKLRGTVGGLCGDFNGETPEDLRDPRGCVYHPSDGIMYATSWTILPCTQNDHVVENLKKHQWDCPRTSARLALPASGTYDPDGCSHSVYPLVKEDGQVCITTTPFNTCQEHCTPLRGTEQQAMFEVRCWPESALPLAIQQAREHGYVHHLVSTPGTLIRPARLTYSQECIPKKDDEMVDL